MATKTKAAVQATEDDEQARSTTMNMLAEEHARERIQNRLEEAECERRVSYVIALRRAERRARRAKTRLVRLQLRFA